jgi:hypothetical protein
MKQLAGMMVMALLVAPLHAEAREFRMLNAIPAPAALPDGAVAVQQFTPVDNRLVESTVKKLVASWNTQDIEKFLGKDFYDKQRLADNIQSFIPRDAKLDLLSVQGQQTLQQYEEDGMRVSRVSVIVNTQIEFNHPTAGFQRFPGRTELVFKVKQPI